MKKNFVSSLLFIKIIPIFKVNRTKKIRISLLKINHVAESL